MPGKRILSDDQLAIMCEKREAGQTYQQIARYFTVRGTSINYKTIRWQCLRLGAVPPGFSHANVGMTPLSGNPFTAAEDAQITAMCAAGHTQAAIARALGRRPNSIAGRIYTLAYYAILEERRDAA